MTRDEIIKLAREAGLKDLGGANMEALVRFATLVAAAEREACAQVCVASDLVDMPTTVEIAIVRKCAAVIRARGQA